MAKTKSAMAVTDTRPLGSAHSWARTNGTYLAGRAYIDGADETACEMEEKWGADRLRLLVSPELREKFDRQRYLFNQAIWHGELEDVRRESGRMVNAYQALDRAAEAASALKPSPRVWEVALANGAVASIVSDAAAIPEAEMVRNGRGMVVYTIEEIARLLDAYPQIVAAKEVFPGAEITAVRRPTDPLKDMWDTKASLDDDISDLGALS